MELQLNALIVRHPFPDQGPSSLLRVAKFGKLKAAKEWEGTKISETNNTLALDIFEDLYYFLEGKLKLLPAKSPHRRKLEEIQQIVTCQRRFLEEISLPGRFLLEHLTELQYRGTTVELEAENFRTKSPITGIAVEEWGKIRLKLGILDVTWRDPGSQYFFYPDKVEIRSQDERQRGFQLFFSLPFKSTSGLLASYPDLGKHDQVSYIHPDLETDENINE